METVKTFNIILSSIERILAIPKNYSFGRLDKVCDKKNNINNSRIVSPYNDNNLDTVFITILVDENDTDVVCYMV